MSSSETTIELIDDASAASAHSVIIQAFQARPTLDPSATALDETVDSVRAALGAHGGLLARIDGRPVGTLLFDRVGHRLRLRRVGVLPEVRHLGLAQAMAEAAEEHARELGLGSLILEARAELPSTVRFWQRLGYAEIGRAGTTLQMLRVLPSTLTLPTADDTRAFGVELGATLRAGDLVVMSGELGAGKTTLTQGLAEGLGVRGPITSPTFVIARIHPSLAGGPSLVHVDAFRLGDSAELDDLDLDADLEDAVTVVEWGTGLAEALADARLELHLERTNDEMRTLTMTRVGERWEPAPAAE